MNDEFAEEIENIKEETPEEVEQASENFTKSLKLFKSMTSSASSKKGLARVLMAAAEFPLGKDYPRLLNKTERDLFVLFQDIMNNKSIVMAHFMKDMVKGEENNGEEEQIMAEDRDSTEG